MSDRNQPIIHPGPTMLERPWDFRVCTSCKTIEDEDALRCESCDLYVCHKCQSDGVCPDCAEPVK